MNCSLGGIEMRFSVVIPVYNVEGYLRRCLDSILETSVKDLEIILVNDGSSDTSGIICDFYAARYENVFVIHQENQGVAVARNTGLLQAIGDYVHFVDPDDYVINDPYQAFLDSEADVIVFSYENLFNENENEKIDKILPLTGVVTASSFQEKFGDLFETSMFYNTWNKFYKRSFLRKHELNFPMITVGEDSRFNFQVYQLAETYYFSDQQYYAYIQGRAGSALTAYNSQRLNYQLEEVIEIQNLFQLFQVKNIEKRISNLLEKLLFSNLENIVRSNLSFNDKLSKIKELSRLPQFTKTIKSTNKAALRLLKYGCYRPYLLLKLLKLKKIFKSN